MMLHAKAGEDFDASVVALDGNGHGHGAFGKFEAVAIVGGDAKPGRHNVELSGRHFEGGMLVDLHERKLTAPAAEVKGERVFPALRVKEAGEEFQPED